MVEALPDLPPKVLNRILAKAIDFGVVLIILLIFPIMLGALLSLIYILISDGFRIHHPKFELVGQSIGKKIMGLKVVGVESRQPIYLRKSLMRNTPVAVAFVFLMIPVWGWLFFFAIGIPINLLEIFLMIRGNRYRRVGDVLADTEVVSLTLDSNNEEVQ